MYKKPHIKRIFNEVEKYRFAIITIFDKCVISTSIEYSDDDDYLTPNLYVNINFNNKSNDSMKLFIPYDYPFKPYIVTSIKISDNEQVNSIKEKNYSKFLINIDKSIKERKLLLMYMNLYLKHDSKYKSAWPWGGDNIDHKKLYNTLCSNQCLCCNSIICKDNWSPSKSIFDVVLEYKEIILIMELNNKNLKEIFESTRLCLLCDDLLNHILSFVY